MKSRLNRRVAAGLGIAAVISMGALTACGGGESPAPSSTTTTTTTVPTVSPTEKSINPTGGNSFTPPVKAPPPPTAIPGTHN
jgi:ABC-type glycerol-3-phosphate transport system substrate-binding protein